MASDGAAISALIAACSPLDANSAYCNLLQCTDFADFCVIAEQGAQLMGWVSGYRPPTEPDSLFVWQVAVAAPARGKRLAACLIEQILARPQAAGVTHVTTTVTGDNQASWAVFEGLARKWGVPLQRSIRFEREAHFGGAHATEWEVRIGPLPARSAAQQEI